MKGACSLEILWQMDFRIGQLSGSELTSKNLKLKNILSINLGENEIPEVTFRICIRPGLANRIAFLCLLWVDAAVMNVTENELTFATTVYIQDKGFLCLLYSHHAMKETSA